MASNTQAGRASLSAILANRSFSLMGAYRSQAA
jgi:hypothetical protein